MHYLEAKMNTKLVFLFIPLYLRLFEKANWWRITALNDANFVPDISKLPFVKFSLVSFAVPLFT